MVSLHFFVKATKIYQFKGKNYKAKDCKMCLGNLSKDFTIDNMKKKKEKIELKGEFLLLNFIQLILGIF